MSRKLTEVLDFSIVINRFVYTVEVFCELLQFVLTMLPEAEDIIYVTIPGDGL